MLRYLKDHPTAFEPETITLLTDALDEASRQVEADKATHKVDGNPADAREILAKHIIDMAQRGERDPLRLVLGSLARLRL